jgi:serine/threonine protein kinase/Tol biopolymer transport system component
MQLTVGDNLGPYKVTGLIGKGGMGEVYRGNDTRLGRSVAIKISAREFNDRFEREARAISTLNHPNICTLYDVGPNYLVLEMVEGETLSKIIERGPLSLDKALTYAVQIVDALAAAHAKGVIHRDLKPGNIIVTRNGVKVLDFGLAKFSTEKVSPESAGNIETVTQPITRAGAVLGTLYYMPPEQVEGKETDERSDIYSFGVVFYEMITGQRPFTGDTQAAVLAAVLKDQPPPMSQRQPATPRALERVVRKCLEKKPDDRWQSARDLKPTLELIDLDAPPAGMSSASASVPIPVQPPRDQKAWLWPAGAAAAVILGAGGTYAYLHREVPLPDPIRFEIGLPGSGGLGGADISPDGRKLAFVVRGADGQTKLWIRSLSTSEARPLDGTEGVTGIPFWSWDSRYLAFGADGKLKKIEAAGGPSQALCAVAGAVAGGLWTADGKIVFGQGAPAPTHQVPASGGTATFNTTTDLLATPSLLPDGRHFVFFGADGIYIASLEDGSKEMPRRVLQDQSAVAYAAAPNTKQGYLLFVRGATAGPTSDGTLMAQPFDPSHNQLAGDAIPIAENVTPTGFSASQTGVLIHSRNSAASGSSQTGTVGVLTWLDRTGKVLSTVGELKGYSLNITLSPDGKRVATSHNSDLWVFEFERGVDTRLTFEPGPEISPAWRGDGSRIGYAKTNPYALYEKPANGAGSPELFFSAPKEVGAVLPSEWTPDGRFLGVSIGGDPRDIALLPAEGTAQTRKLIPLVKTQFNERGVRFSSSGKFFSYTSDETGKDEAYVRPFDPQTGTSPGGQWIVSKGGGLSPHWRGDGKEIFYMTAQGAIMSVDIDMKSGFQPGVPKQLFKLPGEVRFWDVTRDGQKFLIPVPASAANSAPYNVIVNWTSTLTTNK